MTLWLILAALGVAVVLLAAWVQRRAIDLIERDWGEPR